MSAPSPNGFRGALTAAANLAEDAALLAGGHRAARTAILTGPALTLGVAQSPQGPAARRAAREGVPVVRRSSGGSGVLHAPGDLVWSIVLPRADPRVGRAFAASYDRYGAAIVAALAEAGVPTAWAASPGLSTECCLLGPRGQALYSDDRVVGGAAQHLTRTALLHHGVVLWQPDLPLHAKIFGLSGTEDRLVGMAARAPGVRPEALAGRIAGALGRWVVGELEASPGPLDKP